MFVDGTVVLFLDGRHLDLDDCLLLGRQRRVHILLKAPQEVRLEDATEARHLLARAHITEEREEELPGQDARQRLAAATDSERRSRSRKVPSLDEGLGCNEVKEGPKLLDWRKE